MKLIPLTQGKFVKVDDDDYMYLTQWKWTYMGGGTNDYAYRKDYSGSKRKTIRMHRLLMNAPSGMDVDHKNRNGLDNRRDNLRVVNRTQNNFNMRVRSDNTSGCKGVSWCERVKAWRAYIGGTKTRKELGYFIHYKEAVQARKMAEMEFVQW